MSPSPPVPRSALTALALLLLPAAACLAQGQGEWRTDFSRHTVPLDEIVSGGPPKDGIPALDHPRYERVIEAAHWLADKDPVIVLAVGETARAYPLQILLWHEIVNDTIEGRPVAVTYCPLCNTALVFDRRVQGRVLSFGTTGRLRHSDLVMYDRQTESWWQQATGEGIVGTLAGQRLRPVSASTVSWQEFRSNYPDGQVLSRVTGYRRDYGRNPYLRYDRADGAPLGQFFRGHPDGRLPAMARVVALEQGDESVAVPFSALRRQPAMNLEVGGRPIAVFWRPGTASALDASRVADGRDVGATGVFDRRLDGRQLTFEATASGVIRDQETGTEWNLLGRGLHGPLAGRRLTAVPHGDHFWFAWAVFRPATRVVR